MSREYILWELSYDNYVMDLSTIPPSKIDSNKNEEAKTANEEEDFLNKIL